jgi:anti-sigma factor RsiW
VTTDVHGRSEERFSAYLENDLPEVERRALEQHLSGCLQCRTRLERFRTTVSSLSELRLQAPPTFLADIKGQIHRRSRGRFFGRRWMLFGRIPFEWVSLTMIIAMLVYYIVSLQSSPDGVTPG